MLKHVTLATALAFAMSDRAQAATADAKNYCTIDGKKTGFDRSNHDDGNFVGKTATLKCWENGELQQEMKYVGGKKNGYYWNIRESDRYLSNYKDDLRSGDEKRIFNGKLFEHRFYVKDKEVWSKEYYQDSAQVRYYRVETTDPTGDSYLQFWENGKLGGIKCHPEALSLPEFAKFCGAGGKKVLVKTYDSGGKIRNQTIFQNGHPVAADSFAGSGAKAGSAKFVNGKKNGEEKEFDAKGKLLKVNSWKDGERHGTQKEYGEGGKKLVKESIFDMGKLKSETEFYLNGQPKERTIYTSESRKTESRHFDDGKVSQEGAFTRCAGWSGWCEDGAHKSYFEGGKPSAVSTYKNGKLEGTSKEFFQNGKLAALSIYKEGHLVSQKTYDGKGKLLKSEEYEADGSKKSVGH